MGTILAYNGDLSKIPQKWHLCDGINGTPNLNGRFLEGVTSAGSLGVFREAGLPNITGSIYTDTFQPTSLAYRNANAFYTINTWIDNVGEGAKGTDYRSNINYFDASRSSVIYGRSSTVQPSSYTIYYIIKIKA